MSTFQKSFKFCLFAIVLLPLNLVFAQGDGTKFTLSSLSNVFPEIFVQQSGTNNYLLLENYQLAEVDSFIHRSVSEPDTLFVAQDVFIRFSGHVDIDRLVISNINGMNAYRGIDFEYPEGNSVTRSVFMGGNGIFVRSANMLFSQCTFKDNGAAYRSGALTLSNSNATISDCIFENNERSGLNSSVNGHASPQVTACIFRANNTSGGNFPQINLGISNQSTPELPIRIENCQIEDADIMSGGIALTNFLGQGLSKGIIQNCVISNNRYGIALIGGFMETTIEGNIIAGNNIAQDPATGGSGINMDGFASNHAIIRKNTISGNLWGITLLGTTTANIGQVNNLDSPGENIFSQNGNEGSLYALYNNTPDTIWAQNNNWNSENPEDVIFHHTDDASLGWVIFDPVWTTTSTTDFTHQDPLFKMYPQPVQSGASMHIALNKETTGRLNYQINNMKGSIVYSGILENDHTMRVPHQLLPGTYYLQIAGLGSRAFIIQ